MKTELTEKKSIENFNKKTFMFFVILCLFSLTCFADSPSTSSGINGVDTIKAVFGTIYAFFTSAAVRVIAIAGVVFTGIKIITNKGNPEAMKPLIMILLACLIIGCASWFVDKFMGDQIGKNVDELKGKSWY